MAEIKEQTPESRQASLAECNKLFKENLPKITKQANDSNRTQARILADAEIEVERKYKPLIKSLEGKLAQAQERAERAEAELAKLRNSSNGEQESKDEAEVTNIKSEDIQKMNLDELETLVLEHDALIDIDQFPSLEEKKKALIEHLNLEE